MQWLMESIELLSNYDISQGCGVTNPSRDMERAIEDIGMDLLDGSHFVTQEMHSALML